jgi:hypothetical protein
MTSVTYGMRKSLCKVTFHVYQGALPSFLSVLDEEEKTAIHSSWALVKVAVLRAFESISGLRSVQCRIVGWFPSIELGNVSKKAIVT